MNPSTQIPGLGSRVRLPGQFVLLLIILVAVDLSGCGKNDRDTRSAASELQERAHKSMRSGNYRNAINYLEALEARFPFSNESKQAQLDLIFCYYRNGERESAIDAAIQDLPDDLRSAVTLREFDGLSYEEIADIMGEERRRVGEKLDQATEMLKNHLKDLYITP